MSLNKIANSNKSTADKSTRDKSRPSKLEIAAIQMLSSADYYQNRQTAFNLITEASAQGASIAVLPEYFCFMGMQEQDKYEYVEQHQNGELQTLLSNLAREQKIWIVAGTHPIASDDPARPYGRCYVFNDQGQVATWYDKIHLFDVTIADSKGRPDSKDRSNSKDHYCESAMTKAGHNVVCFKTPWGMVGLAVCYDLRFPELFRLQANAGCDILILPAAFTHKTGKQHWDVLIKARAIENLCYFVSAAQGGKHQNGRETWGHSCIVDPWGKTLSELHFGEGLVYAELDLGFQMELRKTFPVLSHCKLLEESIDSQFN